MKREELRDLGMRVRRRGLLNDTHRNLEKRYRDVLISLYRLSRIHRQNGSYPKELSPFKEKIDYTK